MRSSVGNNNSSSKWQPISLLEAEKLDKSLSSQHNVESVAYARRELSPFSSPEATEQSRRRQVDHAIFMAAFDGYSGASPAVTARRPIVNEPGSSSGKKVWKTNGSEMGVKSKTKASPVSVFSSSPSLRNSAKKNANNINSYAAAAAIRASSTPLSATTGDGASLTNNNSMNSERITPTKSPNTSLNDSNKSSELNRFRRACEQSICETREAIVRNEAAETITTLLASQSRAERQRADDLMQVVVEERRRADALESALAEEQQNSIALQQRAEEYRMKMEHVQGLLHVAEIRRVELESQVNKDVHKMMSMEAQLTSALHRETHLEGAADAMQNQVLSAEAVTAAHERAIAALQSQLDSVRTAADLEKAAFIAREQSLLDQLRALGDSDFRNPLSFQVPEVGLVGATTEEERQRLTTMLHAVDRIATHENAMRHEIQSYKDRAEAAESRLEEACERMDEMVKTVTSLRTVAADLRSEKAMLESKLESAKILQQQTERLGRSSTSSPSFRSASSPVRQGPSPVRQRSTSPTIGMCPAGIHCSALKNDDLLRLHRENLDLRDALEKERIIADARVKHAEGTSSFLRRELESMQRSRLSDSQNNSSFVSSFASHPAEPPVAVLSPEARRSRPDTSDATRELLKKIEAATSSPAVLPPSPYISSGPVFRSLTAASVVSFGMRHDEQVRSMSTHLEQLNERIQGLDQQRSTFEEKIQNHIRDDSRGLSDLDSALKRLEAVQLDAANLRNKVAP